MPAINKYGVHVVPAMAALLVVVIFLCSIFAVQLDERAKIKKAIAAKQDRIGVLQVECGRTETAIAAQSNDVNIRQEAVRMGLISSKGVNVTYLEAPQDAVITTADQAVVAALASIWGR
jgi:hypothetical protein